MYINENKIDIDEIKTTPIHKSYKCLILSWCVRLFLQFFSTVAAVLSWYLYNYFIALVVLMLSFVVMGIVRSKLRQSSIPINQQEHGYSDAQIASWFTQQYLCKPTT